jgi:hypothetical protein
MQKQGVWLLTKAYMWLPGSNLGETAIIHKLAKERDQKKSSLTITTNKTSMLNPLSLIC